MAKKGSYKPNKWVYIILFIVPIIFTLLIVKKLDNDTWYLLSEGRYIVRNGIYHIDPLSMHKGLEVVVQNWLSASLFWIIYSAFGEMGLLTMILIVNYFICLLLYKISLTISDNNRVLSLIVMFVTNITLTAHFIVSRPQIFSFIILLSLIYILELYIKKDNPKYLIWIPILSLIEINLHASLWWMLFLFMIPYVIDSFKIPYLNTQGYNKKPLFIAILIAFLVGLINPYGYKAITFIFTSFTDKYMHVYINELLPFTFGRSSICVHMYILTLLTTLIYVYFRNGNIRIRYICLYCGTLLLSLISIKGFSHFVLVSIFPIAYFFKDMFPNDFSDVDGSFKQVLDIIFNVLIFGIVCICFASFLYIKDFSKLKLEHDASGAIDILEKYANKDNATVYSSFNDGGYVEFRGFKAYIDPRAEVFLKINNKKADIFKEDYELQHGRLDVSEFLKKYNFSYLLVAYTDYLYSKMPDENNYFVLYNNSKNKYILYARNDLFNDEEREKIVNAYNEALEKAKEKSAKD